ncbi:ABC transporter permease [Sulfitobacter sp. EhC04]|uniref:branched-chain amino acid ABC transporter permease n=1 Tax=Sulfitobacter sp. EhC04 TaxID=1849168 RepID=UPI0007F37613|nr:branched-chain amino acid ABC transporter permease [Sulfitobacter sp. EhC04]OAN75716.1 ABC transporter permease [Sulfitobacter sp. EhC04]
MTTGLFVEQSLNGLQLGVMLFLVTAGLTLVFGIMDFINLAHGSLFMFGAFLAATFVKITGIFWLALILAVLATGLIGFVMEFLVLRRFYHRSHLDQVLLTFGFILVFNDITRIIWGSIPLPMPLPEILSMPVQIMPGVMYPSFRIAILVLGLIVALCLFLIIERTRLGMWIRAGASDRQMTSALGVNVGLVFTLVFAAGAALAALAGIMSGPISAVQIGMGEPILILALVVTVIGGIGSVKGALIAAIMIGMVDTFGRVMFPPAISSILIYLLMVLILAFRPRGLFPANV